MKRIILIMSAILLTTAVSGFLHHQARAVRVEASTLRRQESLTTVELVKLETEHTTLRQTVSELKAQSRQSVQALQLNPKLADWLLAGSYTEVPGSLVPELRAALGFPWNDSTDYVLVSRGTLRELDLPAVQRDDKISETLCTVLAIAPNEKSEVESALALKRSQFSVWAKANLLREGPSGDRVVRYTIPASPTMAGSMREELLSTILNTLGPDRTELLKGYTANWVEFQLGDFGSGTNALSVMNKPGLDGKPEWFYELSRSPGHTSQSGRIDSSLHPIFRNVFPGGWAEIAQREGFELPEEFKQKP